MNLFRRLQSRFFPNKYEKTYSQCGEDRILKHAFSVLNIEKPFYVDIGAYDPYYFSNTALLYSEGARGICIEPNPDFYQKIRQSRPEDTVLQCGITALSSDIEHKQKYYVMSTPTLNTFSKEEAERMHATTSQKVLYTLDLPVCNINNVLEEYSSRRPNFISIDTEGLEEIILKSLDFKKFGPEVFCIETIEYAEGGPQKKNYFSHDFLKEKGYVVYADTYINTVFVRY